MQVEHQLAVFPNILTDLVNQKYNMVIPAFCIDVCLYSLCKVLNADLIRLRSLLAPVSCGGFTHEIHIDKNIYYRVLNKVKFMPVFFPRLPVFIFKYFFKFFQTSGFCELLLQICQMRKRAAESLHFIEDTEKYIHDRIFILLAAGIALGVNVKKHNVRGCICSQLHVR